MPVQPLEIDASIAAAPDVGPSRSKVPSNFDADISVIGFRI